MWLAIFIFEIHVVQQGFGSMCASSFRFVSLELVELLHKDGQVRKQSWIAMGSVTPNSGIFRCPIAITHDFLGTQLQI